MRSRRSGSGTRILSHTRDVAAQPARQRGAPCRHACLARRRTPGAAVRPARIVVALRRPARRPGCGRTASCRSRPACSSSNSSLSSASSPSRSSDDSPSLSASMRLESRSKRLAEHRQSLLQRRLVVDQRVAARWPAAPGSTARSPADCRSSSGAPPHRWCWASTADRSPRASRTDRSRWSARGSTCCRCSSRRARSPRASSRRSSRRCAGRSPRTSGAYAAGDGAPSSGKCIAIT